MKRLGVMIKIMLIIMLLPVNAAFAEYDITLKLGMDFEGDFEFWSPGTGRPEPGTDNSASFSWEIAKVTKYVDFGAGITYQLKRSLDDGYKDLLEHALGEDYDLKIHRLTDRGDYDFRFVPIYGLVKFHLDADATPHIILQAGYNSFDTEYTSGEQGKAYYGGGIGYTFKNGFLIELLYSVDKGKQKIYFTDEETDEEFRLNFDIEYSKWTFNVGKTW